MKNDMVYFLVFESVPFKSDDIQIQSDYYQEECYENDLNCFRTKKEAEKAKRAIIRILKG